MPKPDKHIEDQLDRLSALGDPVRRALYLHVLGQDGDVSREQAARALRLSRALAAFHLDKLVEAGLLEATYRRLTGRTGPGAGRPSKLYRRAPSQIDVTLPARRYELAARLLARAMAEGGPDATNALEHVAEDWGRQLGREAREKAGARAGRDRLLGAMLETLKSSGFAPRREAGGDVVLGNCPFDALTRDSRSTICGMNHALCRGVLGGLGVPGLTARLEPAPGRCCVVLRGE